MAEQVSDDFGQIELTFAHPTSAAVYLTATESGKQESESIELLPAAESPVLAAEKISLQQVGSTAELKGQAGAAAGKAILRAYDAPNGNSLLLGRNPTGSAGENGAFSYSLQGVEPLDTIYVTQQLATEHGKMFESEPVPIAKSVRSTLPVAEARALAKGTTASVAGTVTAIFEAGGPKQRLHAGRNGRARRTRSRACRQHRGRRQNPGDRKNERLLRLGTARSRNRRRDRPGEAGRCAHAADGDIGKFCSQCRRSD
ncbi:hypothetical protein [Brevibacillus gelatini]